MNAVVHLGQKQALSKPYSGKLCFCPGTLPRNSEFNIGACQERLSFARVPFIPGHMIEVGV